MRELWNRPRSPVQVKYGVDSALRIKKENDRASEGRVFVRIRPRERIVN